MSAFLARRIRRLLSTLATAGLLLGASVVMPGAQSAARAADLTGFEPGLIMSDSIFYDSTTMGAYDIQLFLNQQGASCRAGADGTPCLKDYSQTTSSRAATDRCAGYVGAAGESAATIIDQVARVCGINPQVILVMLQKEQGLVTGSGSALYANRYRSAMGYGCPDTAACDSLYYGFFNQVYSAASQFKNYALNPTRYSHRAGIVNTIAYSPNGGCDASPVYIQNQATASLYNYTPYQPNAAALRAGYGTGDSCSAYGNRNFWNYFTDWFGTTTQRIAFGTVDSVTATSNSITAGGWALDPDTTSPIGVHLYVDGRWTLGTTAGGQRPDVAAAYHKGDLHGYNATFAATAGPHQVCAYAIDSSGGPNPQIGCKNVTVVNRVPVGVIDTATVSGSSLTVTGWAFDPDTQASIGVHFYVDGRWTSATTAADSRSDVGDIYKNGSAHGYSITFGASPGTHTVCAYGIDTDGGPNPPIACRGFAIGPNHLPVGVIDTVSVSGTSLAISGWAFDPDTRDPIGVHFYIDGGWAGATTASNPRADVGAIYGAGPNHGYSSQLTVNGGSHSICAYAIDSAGGPNPAVACRSFTVDAPVNHTPIGVIDSVSVTSSTVTVTGWGLDPDTTASIAVRYYLDGSAAGSTTAAETRADVGAAYGQGDRHGYSRALGTGPGSHSLCVRGVDYQSGAETEFGCRSFTVAAATAANRPPIGVIDSATADRTGLTVIGWAFDPDTTAPIQVQVRLEDTTIGSFFADMARADVGDVYGAGPYHGYSTRLAVNIPPGAHNACIYGVDSNGGPVSVLACQAVTVE